MLRLHQHPTSPYSRKATVAVLLRGDPVELSTLDVTRGEHRSEPFLKLSPFGKMPVLETGEAVIFESTSVIEWLEARGPRLLLPPELEVEARHWDRVGDLYLLEPQGVMLFQPGTEAAEVAQATAERAMALLEDRLADGRDWVCGARFTLGDLSCAIGVDHLARMGLRLSAAVAAWHARCFASGPMLEQRELGRPLMDLFLERRRARLGPT